VNTLANSSNEKFPALDRPWKHSGSARYMIARIAGILRPPIKLIEPKLGTIQIDRNLEVPMRDEIKLRVNVFRPANEGQFPVILSAHPYGKDNFPRKQSGGIISRLPIQYRMLRQKGPITFSTLTTWEAPDPLRWVEQGYAVVNADLRGCGTSDGIGALFSDQEGEDVFDLIEWSARQPWSSGRVGMNGVSYLAISQYKAASLHPPSLAGICVWEGFTDAYRDFARQGGILEDGFTKMWSRGLKGERLTFDFREFSASHPLRDEAWRSLVPRLASIEVPILVCGSFSDHCLHSRGSFRAFSEVRSSYRELYTHRGCKWTTFYSDEAFAAQLAFFNHFLKSESNIAQGTKIRLEVRSAQDKVIQVREETSWPLERTIWTPLYLGQAGQLSAAAPSVSGQTSFDSRKEAALFSWHLPNDTELIGPMAAHLWLELEDGDDVDLFIGVELWRNGRYVGFEGSYGYGCDRVTTGWLKASLRELDQEKSKKWAPEHTFNKSQPLHQGDIVSVDVSLLPSATFFQKDDELHLVIAGRWLSPTGLLRGQFPASYPGHPAGRCILHWGPERPAHLLVPVIPAPIRDVPRSF
jgi:putative CocE/NonD family hydrolase